MRRTSAKLALVSALAVAVAVVAIRFEAGRPPASAAADGGGAPRVSPARARALLAGSPPALAALHRQAGRLLPAGGLATRLRALRGHPVLVNVWASWCPPCRDELPLLAAASARFGRRVAFLGADLEDDPPGARRLLAAAHPSFPSYAADRGEIEALAPLRGTPVTLAFDRRGNLAAQQIGAFPSYSALATFVTSAADVSGPSDG